MKKFNESLMKDHLTRDEMRKVIGGLRDMNEVACKSCKTNSDCASGACIKYSQTGCEQLQCGCGRFC